MKIELEIEGKDIPKKLAKSCVWHGLTMFKENCVECPVGVFSCPFKSTIDKRQTGKIICNEITLEYWEKVLKNS